MIAVMILTVAGACTTPQSATGIVVSVDGPSAAEVSGFSLRTADGQMYDFAVGRLDVSDGGLPAPHLREHLVNGHPITVQYADDGAQLVAVRYVDTQ